LKEYVADLQDYRRLRRQTFLGVASLLVMMLVMFALWLRAFGDRVFNGSLQTDAPHATLLLMPMVVMATLVAITLLPIVRFVFRGVPNQADEQGNDGVSIWQTLIKEVAEIVGSYIGRSKARS
jgi:hypothetical protein